MKKIKDKISYLGNKEEITVIKENLERRFNALMKFENLEYYISLELDYISFIGNNKILGKIVESLALEGEINKDTMRELFLSYLIMNADFDNKDKGLKIPTFLTKAVEKKLNLKKHTGSLLKEMKEEDKLAKKISLSPPNPIKIMGAKTEQDIFDMQKLHNDIMEKLSFNHVATADTTRMSFNRNNSILKFNNKEIVISKSKDSNSHYLLTTIFKNKENIWNYDEIADDWGNDYNKNSWSKYYNACYKINEKVAKETTIKDFLSITTKTVNINKKYL